MQDRVDEALRTVLSRENFSVILNHDDAADAAAFSQDGRILASGS